MNGERTKKNKNKLQNNTPKKFQVDNVWMYISFAICVFQMGAESMVILSNEEEYKVKKQNNGKNFL